MKYLMAHLVVIITCIIVASLIGNYPVASLLYFLMLAGQTVVFLLEDKANGKDVKYDVRGRNGNMHYW